MAASSKGRRKNRPKPTVVSTSTSKSTLSQRRASRSPKVKGAMLFGRKNYLLLGISIVLLIIGYSAMAIDNQIRSFTSLYFAPIVLMAGYLLVIYAIFYRPKNEESNKISEVTSPDISEE